MYMMAMLTGLVSCVEDKGTYVLSPINEVTISGIEEVYNKITYSETLNIIPKIENSMPEVDESQLSYQWFLNQIISNTEEAEEQIIIGSEKILNYTLDITPGLYRLYCQVLDKTTGLKWSQTAYLNAMSPFTRGFYLFGDKEDGTCDIDFVSMLNERDTTVIENLFTNSLNIKGAQNLVFTGSYDYNPDNSMALWAVTESGSYSLEFSSSLPKLDIRQDISADNFIYPTIDIIRPVKVMDLHPHAYGSNNSNICANRRILMTENEFFGTSIYNDPEAYGNPTNRYSASSSELYKPAPYMFYPGNSTYISYVIFYDKTNECFVNLNSSTYSSATYSKKLADTESSNTSFYFDQTKYSPVRTLVYGENGYGNGGRSYALMTDANGKYYVYAFKVAGTSTKDYGREIDQTIATNFAQSSHYAFFSMQTVILYSVGSQLWAYDYTRKDVKMIEDFGSEITYLAMDFNSNDTPTDFIIATYSPSEKGIVRKFTIVDDQNKIEVTPHEKEVWKTNLRVAKVEYRNSSV